MLEPRIMLAVDLPVDLLTGPDDPLAQVAQIETVAPAAQPIRDLPAPTATDADSTDTITDGTNTDTQANTVTDDHRPAVADTGVDRVVISGANVILDGSGSRGDISAYQWELLGQPVVELTGHDTATASFTAPPNTTGQNFDLIFQLTVADPTGLIDTAVVLITVESRLPAQLIGNVVTTSPVTITSGQTLDLGCFNLAAPSVMIEAGGLITGSGSVAAPVSGGGEITLFGGNMSLGDLSNSSGFDFHGTLNLNGNTAVLLDANVAKLGAVTDLGSGGTLVAANGITLASSYSLTGSGTIDSALVNQGKIIIAENQTVIIRGNLSGAGGTDSSGALVITANYTPDNTPAAIEFGGDLVFGPSAHLVLTIDRSQPGSGHEPLNIAGQLTAGGTLEIVLGQNYEPIGDESFDLLNFESFSGALSEPDFTGMPLAEGLQWNTAALMTEGVLSVESTAPPLADDYDESGTVDIDDYALWKSTFGSTTQLAADGNDNGVIDAGDYTIYRDNLGQSSGTAVATSSSAEGEPVIVNTTVDENDGIDAGGISLRDAVAHAATHTDPLDILFANALGGQTITLDSALGDLQINSYLVIDGEGKNISISGGDATSIFKITGGNVTIKNLTLPTVVIESGSTLRLGGSVVGDLINNGALAVASDDTFTPNPDLNETPGGMLNAALSNRNPDCRTYALDANDGDYSSVGADDRSNFDEDAPYYPGTDVASTVHIDLVIVGGDYIQDPDNPTIPGGWDYEAVAPTNDGEAATHCRMVHNMIPNHDFGRDVGLRTDPDVWVTEIDHDDRQVTYLPVHPRMSEPPVADDTDRNPTNFMDYDGVLLNGIGIAMDSGFCYHPAHRRANAAGNATGCGGLSVWYEIPAYTLQEPEAENMAAIFDEYFGHGFEGSYHYHAITHPLQKDDDQATSPSPNGSPLIGFAKDGFPVYGHWFVNPQGELVKARSGYVLKTYELNDGESRDPVVGLPPNFDRGTPPTPWDIANRPEDFDSDFGLPLGRYLDDWVYDDGNTGNLDECNGATDINGIYGYYITDTYPYSPICTFGVHEPSFGKVPPLRWHDETTENTHDDHGHKINGH